MKTPKANAQTETASEATAEAAGVVTSPDEGEALEAAAESDESTTADEPPTSTATAPAAPSDVQVAAPPARVEAAGFGARLKSFWWDNPL